MKIHSNLLAATAAFLFISQPVAAIEFTNTEISTMEKKQSLLLKDVKSTDALVGVLSSEELERLQSLVNQKAELNHSIIASHSSNHLFTQKVHSYISSMNELNARKAQELLDRDTIRIQRAMLHKLEHQRQDLADVI